MKKLISLHAFFIVLTVIFIGYSSCGDTIDYLDETKKGVDGKIIDQNGNPKANYPLQIRAIDYNVESFLNYENQVNPYAFDFVNEVTTDEQGNFTIFFPDTSWTEVLAGAEGDTLQFIHANTNINSSYRILNFVANYENVGTLKLIEN